MRRIHRYPSVFLCACALAGARSAQGPAFQTPGTPVYPSKPAAAPDSGQADRFASVFNPAFSFLVDVVGDYVDFDDDDFDADEGASGFDADLRVLEAAAQAWIDPNAWAYFVGAADEEELTIEEAAVHYVGLGKSTFRAGRFFIDFGKSMQVHVHELRTLERPLVLRAYLGEEVKGDGFQWDHWMAVGDESALRWSLGAFSSLLPEEAAFPTDGVTQEVAERKDLGDLNFTARLTGFRDVGERGTFQVGASARAIPDYTAADEVNSLEAGALDSTVYGMDVTYGWVDDTGEERVTVGAEALLSTGDTGFEVLDPDTTPGTGDESLTVLDDSAFGYFAFADYAWDRYHGAGVQYSSAEIADAASSEASELELYFTRWLSEFHRLRFVVSSTEEETSDDSLRFAVQYTGIVGAHGHGVNW
jgi:hypothetical protein